jgi:hypothetical protein
MYKSLGLLVVILCGGMTLQNALAIARTDTWECPMDKKRPQMSNTDDFFLDYVEPMEFFVETPKQKAVSAKWLIWLTQARDKIAAFNEKTLNPPPTNPSAEFGLALDEMSKVLVQMLFRYDQLKEEGELNQDNATVRTSLEHLVRTFYAVDEQIQKIVRASDNGMKLPQSIIDFKNRLDGVIAEERALRSKRSNNRICTFLEAEKKRRCEGEPFRAMGDAKPSRPGHSKEDIKKADRARAQIENQIKGLYKSINAEFDDKKNVWERISGLVKKTQHESEKPESEHVDTFYKKIAPFFKLCGAYAGLQDYARNPGILESAAPTITKMVKPPPTYQQVCAPFLCEGGNLLMDPEKNPEWAEKGFCGFAKSGADYDAMEAEYLRGFIEAMNSTSHKLSFCPVSTTSPSAMHPKTGIHRRKP